MRKALLFCLLFFVTLVLIGCNGTSEYRKSIRYFESLDRYLVKITNAPDIYVDNINKIISIEYSNINSTRRILHAEGNHLYGFIKSGTVWNRYTISDKFVNVSGGSYLSEMTEICKGNWTEANISLQKCKEQVLVSELPSELKSIIEEILPEDENKASVDIELYYNSADGYISYVRYGYQRVLNEYRLDHPNKIFSTEIEFTYSFSISFSLQLPEVYTEKDETLTLEEFMENY